MVKMRRSQLRDLVKEILVEILQNDVLLQRATVGAMHEAAFQQQQQQALPAQTMTSQFINPMDDNAMIARQQGLSLQQQQLARQSRQMNANPQQQGTLLPDLAAVAGLNSPDPISEETYNRKDHGYRDPTAYLQMAGQARPRFDPTLDSPVAGSSAPRQRFIPDQQQPQHAQPMTQGSMDPQVPDVSPDILRQMFDDTAQTTLQEQAAVEGMQPGHMTYGQQPMPSVQGSGDRFDQVTSHNEPQDLFPGSVQNWASLAFDK